MEAHRSYFLEQKVTGSIPEGSTQNVLVWSGPFQNAYPILWGLPLSTKKAAKIVKKPFCCKRQCIMARLQYHNLLQ